MVKETSNKLEQSTLSKAVKNVKQKLLAKPKKIEIKEPTEVTPRKSKHVKANRGIVYLGHIPHGFFEEQMREYFKQFGRVTRVRLARSKKTGRSRGYGYIEFVDTEVAKIAAESMNNYLMCGRLLKATYIPPEKQHDGFFFGRQWSKQDYPRLTHRVEQIKHLNENVDTKVEAALVQRGLSKLANLEKKLEAAGINYKIEPIDVPKPVVEKRKATTQPPSLEMKKRKLAPKPSIVQTKDKIESKVKPIKNKKIESKVEPIKNKKIESKVKPIENKKIEPKVKPIENKKIESKVKPIENKKIKPKVKPIEKKKKEKISDVTVMPKLKKKKVPKVPSIDTKKLSEKMVTRSKQAIGADVSLKNKENKKKKKRSVAV